MHALALTLVLLFAQQAPAKPAPPPSLTGKWTMTLEMPSGNAFPGLELTQEGEKLTGVYVSSRYGKFEFKGLVKGKDVSFSFTMNAEGTEVPMTFRGEVDAAFQTMKGVATLGEMGEATWTAKRAPQ
jgi:hypothetical protein